LRYLEIGSAGFTHLIIFKHLLFVPASIIEIQGSGFTNFELGFTAEAQRTQSLRRETPRSLCALCASAVREALIASSIDL